MAELALFCDDATFIAVENAAAVDLGAAEPERISEFRRLEKELCQKKRFARLAPETFVGDSLILESDRDPLDVALRRTEALFNDLKSTGTDSVFAAFG